MHAGKFFLRGSSAPTTAFGNCKTVTRILYYNALQ